MRSSINMFGKLMVNGDWVIDEMIWVCVEEYYIWLYLDPFLDRSNVEGVDYDHIDEEQERWLERSFSLEEVGARLNSMEDDKAPGPDVFPIKLSFVGMWLRLSSLMINGAKV